MGTVHNNNMQVFMELAGVGDGWGVGGGGQKRESFILVH